MGYSVIQYHRPLAVFLLVGLRKGQPVAWNGGQVAKGAIFPVCLLACHLTKMPKVSVSTTTLKNVENNN